MKRQGCLHDLLSLKGDTSVHDLWENNLIPQTTVCRFFSFPESGLLLVLITSINIQIVNEYPKQKSLFNLLSLYLLLRCTGVAQLIYYVLLQLLNCTTRSLYLALCNLAQWNDMSPWGQEKSEGNHGIFSHFFWFNMFCLTTTQHMSKYYCKINPNSYQLSQ